MRLFFSSNLSSNLGAPSEFDLATEMSHATRQELCRQVVSPCSTRFSKCSCAFLSQRDVHLVYTERDCEHCWTQLSSCCEEGGSISPRMPTIQADQSDTVLIEGAVTLNVFQHGLIQIVWRIPHHDPKTLRRSVGVP